MALASDIVCMIDKIFKWLGPYAAHEVTIELGEIQSYSGKQQTYGKLYFRKKNQGTILHFNVIISETHCCITCAKIQYYVY